MWGLQKLLRESGKLKENARATNRMSGGEGDCLKLFAFLMAREKWGAVCGCKYRYNKDGGIFLQLFQCGQALFNPAPATYTSTGICVK